MVTSISNAMKKSLKKNWIQISGCNSLNGKQVIHNINITHFPEFKLIIPYEDSPAFPKIVFFPKKNGFDVKVIRFANREECLREYNNICKQIDDYRFLENPFPLKSATTVSLLPMENASPDCQALYLLQSENLNHCNPAVTHT